MYISSPAPDTATLYRSNQTPFNKNTLSQFSLSSYIDSYFTREDEYPPHATPEEHIHLSCARAKRVYVSVRAPHEKQNIPPSYRALRVFPARAVLRREVFACTRAGDILRVTTRATRKSNFYAGMCLSRNAFRAV